MENDIFFMSLAFMNAWRAGHPFNYYSAVIASKDFELCKTVTLPKNKNINESLLVLEIFNSDVDYYESNVYINFVPNANFAACAKHREVSRLVYWDKNKDAKLKEFTDICVEFKYNLGTVIDLLTIIDK